MSNIYITEPPTNGKVLLKTSFGDVDIELWTKECPLASRNFIQLCLEGYYDGTIFHRVIKDFIAQGGDPTGTGSGGESIYDEPFRDEFHSRLRFNRRGLVGMANAGGRHDNGSQFFITLGPTSELQNKHTLFGKVVGTTVFNVLKLNECETGPEDRPKNPYKVISTEVILNPFDDIHPRVEKKAQKKAAKEKRPKAKSQAVKDFKLLSFGDEAEEDEEEATKASLIFNAKSKSHPELIEEPLSPRQIAEEELKLTLSPGDDINDSADDRSSSPLLDGDVKDEYSSSSDEDNQSESKAKKNKRSDDETEKSHERSNDEESDGSSNESLEDSDDKKEPENAEVIKEYLEEKEKYKQKQTQIPRGDDRERYTMELLNKFRSRLSNLKETVENEEKVESEEDLWLVHKLKAGEDSVQVLAKDANTKADDWFDITDPRHHLNKRRRGEADAPETHKRKK